jgi:hypothetical protein
MGMKLALLLLIAAAIGTGAFVGYRATEHHDDVQCQTVWHEGTPGWEGDQGWSDPGTPGYEEVVCR